MLRQLHLCLPTRAVGYPEQFNGKILEPIDDARDEFRTEKLQMTVSDVDGYYRRIIPILETLEKILA